MNPKLRAKIDAEQARFWDFMTMRRLAYRTRQQYGHWLRRYAAFTISTHSSGTHERMIEAFLTDLAVRLEVAVSTQMQAFSALLAFYRDFRREKLERIDALRSQRPASVRHSVPREQLWPALCNVEDQPSEPLRLIAFTLYGCGLRLNEALNLRLRDVRLDESRLLIHHAKHGGARQVPVPCALIAALQRQEKAAKLRATEDRENALPIQIPQALGRKYPSAHRQPAWAFLFPSARPMTHPDTKQLLRWHVPDYAVQRALRKAAAKHGLEGVMTAHALRHSFGDEWRDDVKLLQEVFGHRDIKTTMVYRHPKLHEPLPLDALVTEIGARQLIAQ